MYVLAHKVTVQIYEPEEAEDCSFTYNGSDKHYQTHFNFNESEANNGEIYVLNNEKLNLRINASPGFQTELHVGDHNGPVIDTNGEEIENGASYVSIMRQNLESLKKALD